MIVRLVIAVAWLITAKIGCVFATNAAQPPPIFDVIYYGAQCDGITDDAAAINNAANALRIAVAANPATAAKLVFPPSYWTDGNAPVARRCVVRSTLNFTGIYSATGATLSVTVQGNGTEIYGKIAGAPVIDALGSNQIVWKNLRVISDNVSVPTYGIQIGRTIWTGADYGGGANMAFYDVAVTGYFSKSAFYNFAGEEVTFLRPRFINSSSASGTYGYVADGFNHFNISSAFVTETAPVDVAQSFEETTVIAGSFHNSSANAPAWFGGVTQHRIINTYLYAAEATACVELFNEDESATSYMGIKGLDLDIHCEGPSLATKILIDGTFASPTVRDLTVRDVYEFAASQVFSLGGSATSATLEHPSVSISGGPRSPSFTVFEDPTKYSVKGGDLYLYSAQSWTVPPTFQATVTIPGLLIHAVQ